MLEDGLMHYEAGLLVALFVVATLFIALT